MPNSFCCTYAVPFTLNWRQLRRSCNCRDSRYYIIRDKRINKTNQATSSRHSSSPPCLSNTTLSEVPHHKPKGSAHVSRLAKHLTKPSNTSDLLTVQPISQTLRPPAADSPSSSYTGTSPPSFQVYFQGGTSCGSRGRISRSGDLWRLRVRGGRTAGQSVAGWGTCAVSEAVRPASPAPSQQKGPVLAAGLRPRAAKPFRQSSTAETAITRSRAPRMNRPPWLRRGGG